MFIRYQQVEQATFETDRLENPVTPESPMTLTFYRNKVNTAFYTVFSKKAGGVYWDTAGQKKIKKRQWTSEMRAFYGEKIKEVPKPPFVFKLTVFGYIFLLLVVAFFAYMTYDSLKPPVPKSEQTLAMEQPLAAGDVFFGHFEEYKEKGDRIASGIGFGWFKILKVENDTYYIAKGTEMSKEHKPKEQLNSTDFEDGGTPAYIKTKESYSIRLMAQDDKTEYYLDEKK